MSHPLISQASTKMQEAVNHFEQELTGIRTGRAHAGLVENILVNSYGAKVPLKTIATVSIMDRSTIAIQPWDRTLVTNVEKALQEASLGAQPVSDGHTVRLSVPTTTEEQRKDLCKKVHESAEKSRIVIRTLRTDTHSQMRKLKESSGITEDDFYQLDKELQHVVDSINKSIEDHASKKEKEIMTL